MNLLQKISARATRKVIYFSRDLQHGLGLDTAVYKLTKGSRIMDYHGVCECNPFKIQHSFYYQKNF